MSRLFIDVHCHPLLPTFRKTLLASGASAGDMPIPEWSYDRHLEVMSGTGILSAIASQPGLGELLIGLDGAARARAINEELSALVAADPKRFGAFAVVPLDDMDAAIAETAYALDVLGLDGIGTGTHFRGQYLGDARYEPWFEEMNRRGAVLFVHPDASPGFDAKTSRFNVSVLDFMFDSTRMVANLVLSGTRQRFDRIVIISTHGGGAIPYLATRVSLAGAMPWGYRGGPPLKSEEIMAGLSMFHFDLTASTAPGSLDALLRLVPPTRLLMGTDYPLMPSQTIVPALQSLENYEGLDEAAKMAIALGNARALFRRFA